MNRRLFLKNLGLMGATSLAATSPWLSTFASSEDSARERCRIGMIGPGSRGRFLLSFLAENPKCEVVALADIYQPSLDEAQKIVPTAKTYHDYRQLLEDKSIDGVVIATPLNTHYQIAMDAFDAGKHVYCEKAIAYTMEETLALYRRHQETGKVFFTGQQRLFDPRYIQVMEMVHQGLFGEIAAIHAYWNRNGDWRREVPSPELERLINWRLYKESSKGLMTELACHQLQVGTWALGKLPTRVMGTGAITFWKDGREVYDNVHCIYEFEDGRQMTYASVISNKFYGLEEQILGHTGTVEPERGKFY
ncbi:MAG: Gfo/Idh/MocA family oxidoreductase, partial [Bacteroidales bacterium]|nr:Gfo/Idh/MocA family oxidoreductase [Bacteroidales bacterium]